MACSVVERLELVELLDSQVSSGCLGMFDFCDLGESLFSVGTF